MNLMQIKPSIVFVIFGTRGDVYPAIFLAKHLSQNNWNVTFITSFEYRNFFSDTELSVFALGDDFYFTRAVRFTNKKYFLHFFHISLNLKYFQCCRGYIRVIPI
jgi:UDP:flavonoid glycosyltransferase YjiC (YdhE family)